MKYHFVCFEMRGAVNQVSNVILKGVHPLIWAANPSLKGITTYLLFWIEIDAEVATHPDVQKHFSYEGDRHD